MGKVILIGAGPGDPGLLTIKGKTFIEQAECIVYDRLAAPELLELAPRSCERIYVGKANHHHTMKQEDINALLAAKASVYQTVVRLKGGDPYVFGRGGEEALYLLERGIEVEVVPGVSSVTAVPAYAGIPVTHRGLSKGYQVVTAHSRKDAPAEIDYTQLTDDSVTYIFLMGLAHLQEITEGLLQAGRRPDTPAAVISSGTTANQKKCIASLADLPMRAQEAGLDTPAMIVVGDTVSLAEQLNLFERLPLFGKTCIVPYIESITGERPALLALLRERGGEVLPLRVGKIKRISAAPEELKKLLAADWILFTSKNGVRSLLEQMQELGLDARAIRGRIACVGKSTAEVLAEYFLHTDLIPEKQTGEALAHCLIRQLESETVKVVLFGAEIGGEEIESLLCKCCDFRKVPVYRNVEVLPTEAEWQAAAHLSAAVSGPEAAAGSSEAAVAFAASASAGVRLKKLLEERGVSVPETVYSIGPKCSKALLEAGFTGIREAQEASYTGLVESCVRDK